MQIGTLFLRLAVVTILGSTALLSQRATERLQTSIEFEREPKSALVIGIQGYATRQTGWNRLEYAVNDANQVGDALAEAGYKVERVFDADADNATVKKLLEAQLKKAIGGTFVLFVSGHGAQQDGANYIATTTTPRSNIRAGLSLDDLARQISMSGVSRKFIFVDACRTPAGGAKGSSDDAPLPMKVIDATGLWILYGSHPGSESYELPRLAHGAFAYHLIAGLRGAAGSNGIVRFNKLASFVSAQVLHDTADKPAPQRPEYKSAGQGDPIVSVIQKPPSALGSAVERTSSPASLEIWLDEGANQRLPVGPPIAQLEDQAELFGFGNFLADKDLRKFDRKPLHLKWSGSVDITDDGEHSFLISIGLREIENGRGYGYSLATAIRLDGTPLLDLRGKDLRYPMDPLMKVATRPLRKGPHKLEIWFSVNWVQYAAYMSQYNLDPTAAFVEVALKAPGAAKPKLLSPQVMKALK